MRISVLRYVSPMTCCSLVHGTVFLYLCRLTSSNYVDWASLSDAIFVERRASDFEPRTVAMLSIGITSVTSFSPDTNPYTNRFSKKNPPSTR